MTELLASLKLITDFAWIFVLAAILLSSTPNESFSGPSEMKTWRKRLEIIYGQKVPDTGFVQEPYLKDVLQYLSALLSEVISEIDFTASDLMAGIILVAKRRSRIGKLLPQSAEERGNSDTVEKPLASIGEISHLFQFAEMTYGTPGHAFRRLVQFTIRMICPLFFQPMLHTSSIEADFSTLPSKVIHDDRSSNVANRSAGRGCRSPPDLIFCSRKNSLFEIPFAILCDSCCKSVIITIRGTLSISDLFVDLYTDMSPLKFPNLPADPEVYYAHSGFLRCALNVKEKIISSGILSMIFAENSRHKNYSLTVIGHSLGAAVATLLTYLLRVHHTEFPPARCIAYSPPGAIMSPSASEEVKAYVLSVVIGYDFISRLTKESVVNLLSDIEGAINNSGQKKIRVLWRYMFPSRLRPRRSNKQHTHAGSVLAGSEVSDSNDRRKDLHDSIETYPIGLAPSFKKQPKTAIAGKILHIIPIRPRTLYRPTRSAKCIAVWGKKEDFYDIAIESSMFNTHIPQYAAQFFSPDALYSYPKELGDFSGMPHSEE